MRLAGLAGEYWLHAQAGTLGIVSQVMRSAAVIWLAFAVLMAAVVVVAIGDGRPPVVHFIAATFGVASAALGLGLWRRPSFTLAVISVCVAAFLAFLYVIVWVDGSLGSPWTILFPLMPGIAAILTLMSLAGPDRTQGP